MAYCRNERLVTQGDGELVTIINAVKFLFDKADKLAGGDRTRAASIKNTCRTLSGKVTMLFFVPSPDRVNDRPSDRHPTLALNLDVVPEFAKTDHEFSEEDTALIVDALRCQTSFAPESDADVLGTAQAAVLLYEYERDASN